MDPAAVAAAFDLGEPLGDLVEAARGWGGHNVVYRLETERGTWAVKALHRELDANLNERLAIEAAAFSAGIPMPRPIPTASGSACAQVGTVALRCHAWLSGQAKVNEETTEPEAVRMGEIVATLHGLQLPWAESLDTAEPENETSWQELAEAGRRRRARWAPTLEAHLSEIERLTDAARKVRRSAPREPRVGSHRDLNAHNVLFTDGGLYLIDWDAAGPISPVFERSNYAVLWGRRRDGTYDIDITTGFLRGYRNAGGDVTANDPDTLANVLDSLESWVRKNVRWAVATPKERQDELAHLLIDALLGAPASVETQRAVLREAIARVG